MKIYEYDTNEFNFIHLVSKLFDCDLSKIHEAHEDWLPEGKLDFSKESVTKFHSHFYEKLNKPWSDFIATYKRFVKEVVAKQLGYEDYVFQYLPSFRVHLPGQKVIHKKHFDSDEDHRHPDGEINIYLPLTDCLPNNTIWTESSPGKEDHSPMLLSAGQYAIWNGNKCSHMNKDNTEKFSRVSLDFRLLHRSNYNPEKSLASRTSGKKFVVGEYYEEP